MCETILSIFCFYPRHPRVIHYAGSVPVQDPVETLWNMSDSWNNSEDIYFIGYTDLKLVRPHEEYLVMGP